MRAAALRRFLPSFGNGNGRLEHRADATVELLNAYEREALGVSVSPEDLATVEACSGALYERSIASAAVEPMGAALEAVSPQVLALAGRGLALFGQAVFLIEVDEQGLTLTPSSSWDVQGGVLERDWIYRLDLIGTKRIPDGDAPSRVGACTSGSGPTRGLRGVGGRLSDEARRRRTSQLRLKPS